jgi:hypothetical protein
MLNNDITLQIWYNLHKWKGETMNYLFNRLKEPSTWRGVIWCLSAFGVYHFTGDQTSAITALGMAVAGGAGILSPDKR